MSDELANLRPSERAAYNLGVRHSRARVLRELTGDRPPSRCRRCSNLHNWHRATGMGNAHLILAGWTPPWRCSDCGWTATEEASNA